MNNNKMWLKLCDHGATVSTEEIFKIIEKCVKKMRKSGCTKAFIQMGYQYPPFESAMDLYDMACSQLKKRGLWEAFCAENKYSTDHDGRDYAS